MCSNNRIVKNRLARAALPLPGRTRKNAFRGQIYVIDFILSFSIFMLLIVVSYASWSSGVGRAGDDLEARGAYAAASSALSSVIDYGGFPSGWAINATDPSAAWLKGIGCASRPGVLDPIRLSAANAFFNTTSYKNATKAKLGFGRFDGDIHVQSQSGAYLNIFGAAPDSNQTVLASASRMALLDGQTVWVRVRVWRASYQ